MENAGLDVEDIKKGVCLCKVTLKLKNWLQKN